MATRKKTTPVRKTGKRTTAKPVIKKAPAPTPSVPVTIDHFVLLDAANKMIEDGEARGLLHPLQFSAAAIKEILAQPGVSFLRIYAAVNSAGQETYVLTGADRFHRRIDVRRKKKKGLSVKASEDQLGDMNIAQVCDPVTKTYGQPT